MHTHPLVHTFIHTHVLTDTAEGVVPKGDDDQLEEEAWLNALESGQVDERGYLPAKRKSSALTARQVVLYKYHSPQHYNVMVIYTPLLQDDFDTYREQC